MPSPLGKITQCNRCNEKTYHRFVRVEYVMMLNTYQYWFKCIKCDKWKIENESLTSLTPFLVKQDENLEKSGI